MSDETPLDPPPGVDSRSAVDVAELPNLQVVRIRTSLGAGIEHALGAVHAEVTKLVLQTVEERIHLELDAAESWGRAQERRESASTLDAIRALADDDELLEIARAAVEDEPVDRRDRRLQTMRRNGLAIYEYDGTPSSIIRFGFEMGMRVGLLAIAEHLAKRPATP